MHCSQPAERWPAIRIKVNITSPVYANSEGTNFKAKYASSPLLPRPSPLPPWQMSACNLPPLKINRDAFHNARDLNFHPPRPEVANFKDTRTVFPVYRSRCLAFSPARWWKINRAALHIVGKLARQG